MTGGASAADWADIVNNYWCGELQRADWFTRSAARDAEITERFLALHQRVAECVPDAAAHDPRVALAVVLLLDQMPRNMFRASPRAFETDPLARAACRCAIDNGLDATLTLDEKLFLYLPLEHSEDLADQNRAVALISALGDDEYTRFAIAHRDIIARFGRFPHRNEVLGRPSTDEERAFLQTPGSSF